MAQITWRTLMGPSMADAARPLELARQSINDGFNSFTNAFNQGENRNTVMENKVKEDNLLNFTNALKTRYGTPEAYDAALKTGEIAKLIGGYGSGIDAKAATAYADNQLNNLRSGVLNNINYTDKTTEAAQRPAFENYASRIAAGDVGALKEAQATGIRGLDKLGKLAQDVNKDLHTKQIQDANLVINQSELALRQARSPEEIANLRAQRAQAYNAINVANANLKMNQEDRAADNNLQLAQFLAGGGSSGTGGSKDKSGNTKLPEDNIFSLGVIGTPSGDEALRKALLVDRKMPMNVYNDVVAQAWNSIKNKDGTPAKVPVGSILSAIDRNPDFFSGSIWSRYGDNAHSELQKIFGEDSAASQAELERINTDFAAYLNATKPASTTPSTRNLDALNAALGYTKNKGKKVELPK